MSPTDQYLSAVSYGGYAAQGPNPSLQQGSEYGLTCPSPYYDPNSVPSGYPTAPIVTKPLQDSYNPQTYSQNPSKFSTWDTRFEPSHQYMVPVFSSYQDTPGTAAMAADVAQHPPPVHTTNSTFGDFRDNINSQNSKKGEHTYKHHGPSRGSVSETDQHSRSQQSRRKALPDNRITKGPTQDSVNKRAPSRGKGKANTSLKKEELWESEDQEESTSNTTPRARHNLVEQKYRHRLNAHFDQLLEVLPNTMSEIPGQPDSVSAPSPDQGYCLSRNARFERERKVSKAEVLDRARLYIQSLENDTRRLMADQEELKARWEEFHRINPEKRGGGGEGES